MKKSPKKAQTISFEICEHLKEPDRESTESESGHENELYAAEEGIQNSVEKIHEKVAECEGYK